MIKRIAKISRRTKNTELLNATKIEKVRSKMDLEKCKLLLQLYRNETTKEILEIIANEDEKVKQKGKWTNFVSEMVEICSRVKRKNQIDLSNDSMTDSSMMEATMGPLESTSCPANQSRYMPKLEMLLIDVQSTIELLAAKKRRDFSDGVVETIRYLLTSSDNKERNNETIDMLIKAF